MVAIDHSLTLSPLHLSLVCFEERERELIIVQLALHFFYLQLCCWEERERINHRPTLSTILYLFAMGLLGRERERETINHGPTRSTLPSFCVSALNVKINQSKIT